MIPPTIARWKRWGKVAGGVGLCLAYSLLAHLASIHPAPGVWQVLMALSLVLVLAVSLVWRSTHRPLLLSLCLAGVVGLVSMGDWLRLHYQWLFFLEHAGVQSLLCIAFGRTLAAGQTPLVSRFAAVVHGPLSPQLQRYTRGVTWAWTLYFGLMASLSVLLFSFAPMAWWSAFANLLDMPLVALMFVGDYLVRRCVLPPEQVAGLWQAVRAYQQVGMRPLP
ncbi:hypothetical protein [Rhodoferax sp.]|uniref:COG4648 family protein n=1 Tax=Rhodoferax sp. TaxID=50421 RepID=UPI0025EE2DAC|nr:hypothetical protein [Rhodoferax sp.]